MPTKPPKSARKPLKQRPSRKRRRIAIVTGTRAEFGLLEPVIQAIKRRRGLEPRLIVTGMHLLRKFGRTIDEIRDKGYRIDATVKMQTGRDVLGNEALAVSRGIAGIARALDEMDCDTVVVLGDRIEAFAGAVAGATGRRMVAHIHGGDRALGDIDDSLRNAITRLAHLHLAASKNAADRLKRMGEDSWRIKRVGAPGLDYILRFREADSRSPKKTDRRVAELLGPIAERPYGVVIQHPSAQGRAAEAAIMRNIVAAVERCELGGVVVHPNSDPGHDGILEVIAEVAKRPNWQSIRSFVREDYLRVTSRAAVLVGNSSSGIIESASLGVSAVNIGSRQAGRLRCGPSVLDAGESVAAITRAIRRALNQPRPRAGRSVYGDGRAGERIAESIAETELNTPMLQKLITY